MVIALSTVWFLASGIQLKIDDILKCKVGLSENLITHSFLDIQPTGIVFLTVT